MNTPASGRVVNFGVHMRSRAAFELDTMGGFGELEIACRLVTPKEVEELSLPVGTTYAWAVVQKRPGQPDALLFGGTADSLSAAQDMAQREYLKREDQRARQRVKEMVRS